MKHLTLGFCSGHDLTDREFEPCIGLRSVSEEPAWDSLSLPGTPPLVLSLSLSLILSQDKYTIKNVKIEMFYIPSLNSSFPWKSEDQLLPATTTHHINCDLSGGTLPRLSPMASLFQPSTSPSSLWSYLQ